MNPTKWDRWVWLSVQLSPAGKSLRILDQRRSTSSVHCCISVYQHEPRTELKRVGSRQNDTLSFCSSPAFLSAFFRTPKRYCRNTPHVDVERKRTQLFLMCGTTTYCMQHCCDLGGDQRPQDRRGKNRGKQRQRSGNTANDTIKLKFRRRRQMQICKYRIIGFVPASRASKCLNRHPAVFSPPVFCALQGLEPFCCLMKISGGQWQ